jgi:molybdenum cofactor biosynthesis enzyme MoaA
MTCTGTLYMCLGQEDAADLGGPLRVSEGNERIEAAIEEAISRKPKGHHCDRDDICFPTLANLARATYFKLQFVKSALFACCRMLKVEPLSQRERGKED